MNKLNDLLFYGFEFNALQVLIRCVLSIVVGGIVGNERARHGRAAGLRTHILVCIGAAITSMTGLYAHQVLGVQGDVFRIAAQVVSGIGFLGAGMIILKNNNVITGLTTAAALWATAAIGIAIGFGFYFGAICVSVCVVVVVAFFSKIEKRKKDSVIYIEIDDINSTNSVIETIKEKVENKAYFQVLEAKSRFDGHIGLNVVVSDIEIDAVKELLKIEHIILAVVE